MQNVNTNSKFQCDKRRHTDAGEHALSILAAKNELESQLFNSEFQQSRKVSNQNLQFSDDNSNPGLFKRLFRSKSYKKPNNLNSFPLEQSNLSSSNIRSIFLLFRNRLEEVTLPVQPTLDWLVLTFKLNFDVDFQIGEDTKFSFVIKEPNSDFFDPLLQFQKIRSKSIISICNHQAFNPFICPKLQEVDHSFVNQKPRKTSYKEDIAPKSSLKKHLALIHYDIIAFREDIQSLRSITSEFQLDFDFSLKRFSHLLYTECNLFWAANSPLSDIPLFRHERFQLHEKESQYLRQSSEIYTELELLELSIENIRIDVSKRGCRIVTDEIDFLNKSISDTAAVLFSLRRQYLTLEPKLKEVMALELEVIVKEEKFVKNESFRLEESIFKCRHLNNILISLRKLSNISAVREFAPLEISVEQFVTSDMHVALMDEIKHFTIDHIARVRSIELSIKLYIRKNQLNTDPMKIFTKDLQIQKGFLRKTNNLSIITNRNNLNYHKLLEDYKREKFLQRSNRSIISHSITDSSPFDNRTTRFGGSSNLLQISQINRDQGYLQLTSSETLPTSTIFTDIYKPNSLSIQTKKNYYGQFIDIYEQNRSISNPQIKIIPSVPGPPNLSNHSFKYYTRPQEDSEIHFNATSPVFQQYSLV